MLFTLGAPLKSVEAKYSAFSPGVPPEDSVLKEFVKSRLEQYTIEAALLERGVAESHAAFVEVPDSDLESVLSRFR